MDRQRKRRIVMTVSMLMFPVVFYYFSPVLILGGAATGIVTGSAMLFMGLFASSLFLGRAWCAWGCPAGGLQETCARVRGKPAKGGRRDLIKWVIWTPWIGMILVLFVRAGGIWGVDPLYMTYHGLSVYEVGGLVLFIVVAGLIALVALLAGRRGFCHYACWMAPFMILGMWVGRRLRVPRYRLTADPSKCVGCKKCSKRCPMSLDVSGMVRGGDMDAPECIMCATCADTCPKGVISVTFAPHPSPGLETRSPVGPVGARSETHSP